MDVLIFLIFIGIIIFNISKASSKTAKKMTRKTLDTKVQPSYVDRLNSAQRTIQTGTSTAAKAKAIQQKRRKVEMKVNTGLWASKHRVDKNRHRRTDWGARGQGALFTPQMIAVIGGGAATIYFAITTFSA